MRLVNTTTLQLEEFQGDCPKPYSILSHTWERDEIAMQQLVQATSDEAAGQKLQEMAGYVKVVKAAELAAAKGYELL